MIRILADTIITPYRRAAGAIDCMDGRIASLGDPGPAAPHSLFDLRGLTVTPGLIDLHVHGGGGHSFWSDRPNEILSATQFLGRHGITALCPTVAFLQDRLDDTDKRRLDAMSAAICSPEPAPQILGLHLEGPYASQDYPILPDQPLLTPAPSAYRAFFGYSDHILRCTLSPHSAQSIELVSYLVGRGIYPSIGHACASFEDVCKAYEAGAHHITHIYSSMNSVYRTNGTRQMGILESAFALDGMDVEMIANGKHLSDDLMRLIIKLKTPEHICVVSDANEYSGHPDGPVTYLGYEGYIQDGVILRKDGKGFLGSTTTSDQMLRHLVKRTGVSIQDAIRMCATTPARSVGFGGRKGVLSPGYDADIIAFDDEINIRFVMARGEVLYCSDDLSQNR